MHDGDIMTWPFFPEDFAYGCTFDARSVCSKQKTLQKEIKDALRYMLAGYMNVIQQQTASNRKASDFVALIIFKKAFDREHNEIFLFRLGIINVTYEERYTNMLKKIQRAIQKPNMYLFLLIPKRREPLWKKGEGRIYQMRIETLKQHVKHHMDITMKDIFNKELREHLILQISIIMMLIHDA